MLLKLGHAMAQTVSDEPVTVEARVHYQDNACGICGAQNDTGIVSFSEYFGFPLSLSSHQCFVLIHSSVTDAVSFYELAAPLNNTLAKKLIKLFLHILLFEFDTHMAAKRAIM
jgi:hypothetical protein